MDSVKLVRACAIPVLVLALGSSVALSAEYYVAKDGNDAATGAADQPFQTIIKGLSVVKAGDTLIVKAGTYAESLANKIPPGTSEEARVTLKANPGDTVTIQPEAPAERCIDFSNSDRKYITVDGFVLDGANITGNNLRIGGGASFITIQNCEITKGQTSPVSFSGDGQNRLVNCKIHDAGKLGGVYIKAENVTIEGCEIYNQKHGIDIVDKSKSITIRKSKIHDCQVSAINIHGGAGHLVSNNILNNNRYYGVNVGPASSGVKILNNTMTRNGVNGVNVQAQANGTIVKNNILFPGVLKNDGAGTVESNNLAAEPLFMNAAKNDFHLQATSPAVDAGEKLAEVTDDFEGNARPRGNAYDIGAYESSHTAQR